MSAATSPRRSRSGAASGVTDPYIAPDFASSALVTIDTQRDTLDGQPFEVAGTSDALPPPRRRGGGAARARRLAGGRAGSGPPPRRRAPARYAAPPRRRHPARRARRGGHLQAALGCLLPDAARGPSARARRLHARLLGLQLSELPARVRLRGERARLDRKSVV